MFHFKLILNINIPSHPSINEIESLSRLYSFSHTNVNLNNIKMVLNAMPNNTSYVITRVDDIIAELFTRKGCGTYFKIKEKIMFTNNLADLNLNKLKLLIETSFEKKLKDDYFQKLKTHNPIIFMTETYSAMAIVIQDFNNFAYLDKFCVAAQHQVLFH